MKQEKLEAAGYKMVGHGPNGTAWVRIRQRGNWMVGQCVIITPGLAFSIGAAACLATATMSAVADAAINPPSVPVAVSGGMLRRLGKKFRRQVNEKAKQIAKIEVVNKLRGVYLKAIQSPIVDMGIAAGARALSAFGVPASATRLALTQRRNAISEFGKQGGVLGATITATGPGGLDALARQAWERNKQAAIDALPSALPMGGIVQALGPVSTGYDPDSARATYLAGLHA